MQLNEIETGTLAAMLCDYAEIEGTGITPPELELIIKIATNANFPQNSIEHLWRIHAEATALLEA